MTYIALINHFWQQFENKGMKPNDALLYFFLLKECNRKSWQNPFPMPNKTVVIALDISEKSVIDSRRRLAERGLIQFSKGDRNCESPGYYLTNIEINNDDEEFLKNFNLPTESRMVDEKSMNGRRTVDERQMKRVARIKNRARKTIDLKTIDNISPNGDIANHAHAESQLPLVFDEDKGAKRKSKAKEQPAPPTYEEVRQYFLSQDADKRLENWEETCMRFFDNFTAVGWRDKYNRRITRWDSRANSWIMDDEKRQREKTQTNETKPSDRFSERRGTEPDAKSRKGFKGTL